MRLNRLEIENFKGIGSRQFVEFSPITLLFGPNSAGKSTILQSLQYLNEILHNLVVFPDQKLAGGTIDFGGFRDTVHRHNTENEISFELLMSLDEDDVSQFLPLNLGTVEVDRFAKLKSRYLDQEATDKFGTTRVSSLAIAVNVCGDDSEMAFLSKVEIRLNDEHLVAVENPRDDSACLSDLNLDHSLLRDTEATEKPWLTDSNQALRPTRKHKLDQSSVKSTLEWELLNHLTNNGDAPKSGDQRTLRIPLTRPLGAVNSFDKGLDFELYDTELKSRNSPRVNGLLILLSELVAGPVCAVIHMLSSMTYIGPLRRIPPRNFNPRISPIPEAQEYTNMGWAQGVAAWTHIEYASGEELDRINDWLCGEDKLQSHYCFHRIASLEMEVETETLEAFVDRATKKVMRALKKRFDEFKYKDRTVLVDLLQDTVVEPVEVGVGISQMIPIVVACLMEYEGLLCIEQPELHLHPAIQTRLGDLFIEAVGNEETDRNELSKNLMVETHSEHLLLRLLRRIRETTDEELPEDRNPLKPDQLTVVYIESTAQGTMFRPLRVGDDGDFIDRWPRGFFDERIEELS